MKTWISLFFKIFLVLAFLLFIGVAVYAAVIWAKWPLWVSPFIVAGIVGFVLAIVFIQKIIAKKREQKFVSQIIEQDNADLDLKTEKDRDTMREMQAKWKQSVEALKKSHLKKQGNPLYVLPWYMIIGKSGSGKTTAIKSADLSSSFAEVKSVSGISGTRNCDWWFFEQAVLIDTAGRYSVRVDEERDKDEWQRFLQLLAKYRKKEPLNGLIVTVSVDELNTAQTEDLERQGRDLRKRVDELMRVLESKFPIYIMVTKCDLIQGMTAFCDTLSEDALGQAMGIVNHGFKQDSQGLVTQCFKSMGEQIRNLRLLMMQKRGQADTGPDLILFPKEFGGIESGLRAYVKGLFQENPYQESPLFRGIYFSSGCQEGTPFSSFLKDMGLISEQEVLPGTSRGLFLHDFFSKLLPSDRGLFTQTRRGAAWSRLTRNIGFAAWTTLIIFFCGILSFSFVKNLNIMKQAAAQFATSRALSGELISDIDTLEKFETAIKGMAERNRNWWIPRLGLTNSIEIEAQLKEKYCRLIESRFLDPFDKKMAENMIDFNAGTPQGIYISHVAHLVRRINCIKAKLAGSDIKKLTALPQPAFNTVDIGVGKEIVEDVQVKINSMYLNYLSWQGDTLVMNQRRNTLEKWLARVLSMDGKPLNWLVAWANSDTSLGIYRISDFWGRNVDDTDLASVPAGFTIQGRKSIDNFIADIEHALANSLILAKKKRDFHQWYRTVYVDSWFGFIADFDKGITRIPRREQWLELSDRVGRKKGPYMSLLDTVPKELAYFSRNQTDTPTGRMPDWVSLAKDLSTLDLQAAALRKAPKASSGVLGRAATAVKTGIDNVKIDPADAVHGMDPETMLRAAKNLMIYQDNLAALSPMVVSRRAAFDLATTIYTEDPATSDIPFFKAGKAFKKLKPMPAYQGKETDLIWDLLKGPLNFFHQFALNEAACRLQKEWEQGVLMEMQGIPGDRNKNALLLGRDGYVTKFINGPGKPFIKRTLRRGYQAAVLDGKKINFDPYFFRFLTRGIRAGKPMRPNYTVNISGMPTSANDESQFQPHATVLELICSDKTTTLENLNFPVQRTFRWSPTSECDTIFTIKIGSLDLIKRYEGNLSFPKFLKEFPNGHHTFTPSDFPGHRQDLTRMGVKAIRVRYQMKGNRTVAGLVNATPGRIPGEIVTCWK